MNKKLLALLGLCLVMASAAGGPGEDDSVFTINQASDLLHELLAQADANLSDLHAAWDIKKPLLEGAIASLEAELAAKQEECSGLDTVLADRQKELKDAQDYAQWLVTRIEENTQKIKDLLEQRCQQNGAFVEGLKNDKIALKLLGFLRQQIQDKENFDESGRASSGKFIQKIMNFISIYRSGDYEQLALLQQDFVDASAYDVTTDKSVTDRSAEEIGAGHVDNNQGNIDLEDFENGARKGWVQVQREVLELLNALEETINKKITQSQADEIRSATAAAEYKLQLEHEIEVFTRDLEGVTRHIAELVALVAQDEENVNNCRAQEASIQGQLTAANEELVRETEEFEHKRAGLEEEIQVFTEVIALYDETHTLQDDDFKERVEDYSDQSFDNGDYNAREVPKIDLLTL